VLKGPGSENEQALTTSWSMKLLIAAVIVAFGALIGWGFLTGRNVAAVEAERERAIKAPIRVSGEAGETVITLDMETQQRSGIERRCRLRLIGRSFAPMGWFSMSPD
jgi:hypothetical protein